MGRKHIVSPRLTKEYLFKEIIVNRRHLLDVAKELNVSIGTIDSRMKKYKLIRVRETFECSKEYLIEQNQILKQSMPKIAAKVGCTYHTIANQFKRHGISSETRSQISENAKTHLLGKRFGKLTVISFSHCDDNKSYFFFCNCDCGRTGYPVPTRNLQNGNTQSCGCGRGHFNMPTGELSWKYWQNLRKAADRRNIKFDITQEYLWNLFLQQERKCALTGDLLVLPQQAVRLRWRRGCNALNEKQASLDRIDSTKGYIEGNVQWVSVTQNIMKMSLPIEVYVQECAKVANHLKLQLEKDNTQLCR